jgi:hypothetical protein
MAISMGPVGGLEAKILCFQPPDRPNIEHIIPQAVLHSLTLLKMGRTIAQNMSS